MERIERGSVILITGNFSPEHMGELRKEFSVLDLGVEIVFINNANSVGYVAPKPTYVLTSEGLDIIGVESIRQMENSELDVATTEGRAALREHVSSVLEKMRPDPVFDGNAPEYKAVRSAIDKAKFWNGELDGDDYNCAADGVTRDILTLVKQGVLSELKIATPVERVKVANNHHMITNAEVNDLTLEHLGKWSSFDHQWWAGNVVDVVLNHLAQKNAPATLSPAKEPEPIQPVYQWDLHRDAAEAHSKAEDHARTIAHLSGDSSAHEILTNEYFELARAADAYSSEFSMNMRELPEQWDARIRFHSAMVDRHQRIAEELSRG